MDDFHRHNQEQNETINNKERERREALSLLAELEEEEKQRNNQSWKDLIYPEEPEKQTKKKTKTKKEKSHKNGAKMVFLLLLSLALLAGVSVFCYIRFAPTTSRMDPVTYFEEMMSTDQERAVLAEDERAIVMESSVDVRKARVVDEAMYLDYMLVREKLNSRFFWDEENQTMLYTTALETWEIPVNSSSYTIDGEEQSYERKVLLSDERGLYFDADFLQRYTNVEYAYLDESHVWVWYDWGTHTTAQIKRNTAVRFSGGFKSLILTEANKGDTVWILEETEHWCRIVSADGFIGYVPKSRLTPAEEEEFTRDFEEAVYPSLRSEETVNLVWHMIGVEESNSYFSQDTEGMHGVNVISPTWFSLTDSAGNFESFASKSYVRKAHKAGLQVWGLVSNFSPDMSTAVLVQSTAARRNLIANLIREALECGMDGINVDLEAITEDAGYGYVQLIRELSIACRKNNLVLSVDVPVPFSFNTYYDRKELGTVADYVIMMGYDEHYAGSEAGSVASLSFEENGITETLKEVEKEKIISAIPFYTRMWYIQTDENGETSTWSEVLGMRSVLNTLETYDVTPVWDEEAQQYLALWTLEDGIECRIWMEDATSLALKAGLVKTYNLGGVAEWALGNQIDEMWDVIEESIA